ncbi:MAG: V-type ATP synthase subunit E [Candidatus Hodarchaeales archaeon]|jgi:vacuolar-type H+-ATPase subunit E/Vma4
MSDIQQLEQEIILDAQKQAEGIIQNAKLESDKILKQAEEEKNSLLEKINHELAQEQQVHIQRELSRIRLQNKIKLENIKESLIEEIFQGGLDQIQKLRLQRDNRYAETLSKIIISSGISLGGGDLEMQINPDDTSMIEISSLNSEITEKTGSETTLKISTSKTNIINGGVILFKGSLSVNNSLQAIFDRRSDIIRNRLNKLIFEDSNNP